MLIDQMLKKCQDMLVASSVITLFSFNDAHQSDNNAHQSDNNAPTPGGPMSDVSFRMKKGRVTAKNIRNDMEHVTQQFKTF